MDKIQKTSHDTVLVAQKMLHLQKTVCIGTSLRNSICLKTLLVKSAILHFNEVLKQQMLTLFCKGKTALCQRVCALREQCRRLAVEEVYPYHTQNGRGMFVSLRYVR